MGKWGQVKQQMLGWSCSHPQELVLEPVQRRARLEGLRYVATLKQQAAQHSTALLHWGALWRQLSSPCGAWALRWARLRVEGRAWRGGSILEPFMWGLGGMGGLQPSAHP